MNYRCVVRDRFSGDGSRRSGPGRRRSRRPALSGSWRADFRGPAGSRRRTLQRQTADEAEAPVPGFTEVLQVGRHSDQLKHGGMPPA